MGQLVGDVRRFGGLGFALQTPVRVVVKGGVAAFVDDAGEPANAVGGGGLDSRNGGISSFDGAVQRVVNVRHGRRSLPAHR
jgi:hypothetical protein